MNQRDAEDTVYNALRHFSIYDAREVMKRVDDRIRQERVTGGYSNEIQARTADIVKTGKRKYTVEGK